MNGYPSGPWGKLKSDTATGNIEAWHPLADHCADVAACCEALLKYSLIGIRLATLASLDQLDDSLVFRLSVLAGLHDMGKFNHGFQAKSLSANRNTAGHVKEMLALIGEGGSWTRKLVEALDYGTMVEWTESERTMISYLQAVISHHGRPQQPAVFYSGDWKKRGSLDPLAGIAELRIGLRNWYPGAWSNHGTPLPCSPAFQHSFYGLVTLADWIASDEKLFPFTEPDAGDRMQFSRRRAREVLAELWLQPSANCSRLVADEVRFEQVLPGKKPRALQKAVLDLELPAPGTITVLEAETGSGKTEAAMIHFFKLFRAGLVDGLYFALPTRTAATQIHRRVTDIVSRVFSREKDRPPVVMAVPGYLRVDDMDGQKLSIFEMQWPDDESERQRYRGWAAEGSKRYLAGAIAVGTIDQVLLSSLQVRHSHLRAAALLRHLLVVDEVHASDLYMSRLLKVVLDRHRAAGGHALLMSATLGAETREYLVDGDCTMHGQSKSDSVQVPYPQVMMNSASAGTRSKCIDRNGPGKTVRIELVRMIDDPEAVARRALDAAAEGGKTLVLRNTVKDCLATQDALEDLADREGCTDLLHQVLGRTAPHHSRYARADRILLDEMLESEFGASRPGGGRVVAATQTVQQSLDLDADLLITDLCPMDVLLQRIGRLHRHSRKHRPVACLEPRVIVLVPEQRDLSTLIKDSGEVRGVHGLGYVYDDLRIIEATWRQLESRSEISIPEENRELVEASQHSEVLQGIVAELKGPWPKHSQCVQGAAAADRLMANFSVSNWDVDFLSEEVLFSSGPDKRISTRLGEGDRLVHFDGGVTSPFGQRIHELTIPCWMCRDVAADARIEYIRTVMDSVTFNFGNHRYTYDRKGLRLCD